MFPTQLELDVLHAERLRQAEHYRMLREIGAPSLFERIRARLSKANVQAPAEQIAATVSRPVRRDAVATSR